MLGVIREFRGLWVIERINPYTPNGILHSDGEWRRLIITKSGKATGIYKTRKEAEETAIKYRVSFTVKK